MRVRALVPGAVTACAVALAGCGGADDVRTVTVTSASGSTTVPAPDPAPVARTTPSAPTTTRSAAPTTTATTTRTATVTTIERDRVTTTERVPDPSPSPAPKPRTTPTPPAGTIEADPVGGTRAASGRVAGTGYSVVVPDGWNDGLEPFEGSAVDVDRVYVKGRGSAVTSNILVIRTAGSTVRGRSITALRAMVRKRLEASAGGAPIEAGPELRIDGERALTFLVRRRVGSTAFVQRQVAVVRDGALFVVALNVKRVDYPADRRVLAAFLRSWRWG